MCVKDFNIPMEKEFLDSIDTRCYSDENSILKAHCYLIIAQKYAGNVVDVMIDHFMNCAVCAGVIAQQIELSKSMFKYNQNR